MCGGSGLRLVVRMKEDAAERLVSAMHFLSKYRREERRSEFEQVLHVLGMRAQEASRYYDLIDLQVPMMNGSVVTIGSNRDLAAAHGILLLNTSVPRCWLLYRLCELIMPDDFQVSCSGSTHMGGKKARKTRWVQNPLLADRRTITFRKCPLDPETGNPLPLHRLLF